MKHPTLWTKSCQARLALTCLIAVLLLSHCRGTHKGNLQTTSAFTGQNAISNPKKNAPETIPVVDKSVPPIGFWTDDESGLYVSIRPRTGQVHDDKYEVAVGDLTIDVGGPPNKRLNADDVFFLSKYVLEKNALTMTGFFNWDRNKNEVDLKLSWTESSLALEIFKNDKFTRYEAKHYVLKLRK